MSSNSFSLTDLSFRLLAVLLLIGATVLGLRLSLLSQPPTLVIVCDGRTAARIPLDKGPVAVWYNWTHSVEGSRISEKILAEPWGLVLVEARAKSFGAGHPYNAEELGGKYTIRGGEMVYTARQPLGRELDIVAYTDYEGNITIITGSKKTVVCESFTVGRIAIEGPLKP